MNSTCRAGSIACLQRASEGKPYARASAAKRCHSVKDICRSLTSLQRPSRLQRRCFPAAFTRLLASPTLHSMRPASSVTLSARPAVIKARTRRPRPLPLDFRWLAETVEATPRQSSADGCGNGCGKSSAETGTRSGGMVARARWAPGQRFVMKLRRPPLKLRGLSFQEFY
jgi:hypothetical protein